MSLGVIFRLVLLFVFIHRARLATVQNKTCGPDCALLLKQMGVEVKFLQDNCMCEENTCRCCFVGSWPELNITQEFCMRSAFISEDFEIQVNASLNGNVLGKFVLSGRNPPPLCFPVPFPIPIPLAMCVRARDIYPMDANMHLCVDMMMRFAGFDFLTLFLSCMWIGADGVELVNQP